MPRVQPPKTVLANVAFWSRRQWPPPKHCIAPRLQRAGQNSRAFQARPWTQIGSLVGCTIIRAHLKYFKRRSCKRPALLQILASNSTRVLQNFNCQVARASPELNGPDSGEEVPTHFCRAQYLNAPVWGARGFHKSGLLLQGSSGPAHLPSIPTPERRQVKPQVKKTTETRPPLRLRSFHMSYSQHMIDSRAIFRVDTGGFYRRGSTMAPTQLLLRDPCPFGLPEIFPVVPHIP